MLLPCRQTTKQKLSWDWFNLFLAENPASTYTPGVVWRREPAITEGRVFPHSGIPTYVVKLRVMEYSRSVRIPVAELADVERPRPVRIEHRNQGLSRRERDRVGFGVAKLSAQGGDEKHEKQQQEEGVDVW